MYEFDICCDLLMLHNVPSPIAISVRLKIDKPLDCSVELEDEYTWP